MHKGIGGKGGGTSPKLLKRTMWTVNQTGRGLIKRAHRDYDGPQPKPLCKLTARSCKKLIVNQVVFHVHIAFDGF